MSEENVAFPEVGELVICTAINITPYGVYLKLDEYEKIEGFLHISEVSSRWVKNIREHVKEGQKTVLKVLRVDPGKFHADLSLRRVNERERKEKLLQWKQEIRGRRLLELAAEKMQVDPNEAYEKIGKLIEENFDSIYLGLESTVKKGESELTKSGVPSEWASILTEIARLKIKTRKIKIRGNLELMSTNPDGVNVLKNVFTKAKNIQKPEGSNIRAYTIGAPRYRIEVTAENYKDAEDFLERFAKTAIKAIKTEGGEGKILHKHAKEE